MSVKLPVFELHQEPASEQRLMTLATEAMGAKTAATSRVDGRTVARSNGIAVERYDASGGIFAADQSRLRDPSSRPTLPSSREAYAKAEKLLSEHRLVPELGKGFALAPLPAGGSVVATSTHGKRLHHALDIQARYGVTLKHPGIDGEPAAIPMVGGGGKFSVTFGDGGRPLALQTGWRPATGSRMVSALDRAEASEQFRGLTQDLELADVSSFLAYHAAPGFAEQELLTPVYVFGATVLVEGERIPMRRMIIPATEFGPAMPAPTPQPPRQGRRRRERPAAADSGPGMTRSLAVNPSEIGTSWIGELGGLTGSQQNAQGFVDGLSSDGWLVNFNWGNANAWESDWDANDDDWVDAADFVFYTGHANQNGWLLVTPGTQNLVQLTPSVVGAAPENPGDKWGQQDLEWIVVAACGPLQDDILARGGGDVLTRWEGAFDGLHTLMGYGAITFDNVDEGRKVAQYSKEGSPVIDAWFRTAQEVQPGTNGASAPDGPTVWVGAMYVTKPGADPRGDHIWGHGSVSDDPRSPTELVCMWTTC